MTTTSAHEAVLAPVTAPVLATGAPRAEVHPDVIYRQIATGVPAWITDTSGSMTTLPFGRWLGGDSSSPEDLIADELVLGLCTGATVDIGCGPGRFVAALHHRGVRALGVDISSVAVKMTLGRGAQAHHGDVFGPLPKTGEWRHVLLADGNIGICGDPLRLLQRAAELLSPGGTVVAELDPDCVGIETTWIRWETPVNVCRWFPWAKVGIGAAASLAGAAGLIVESTHTYANRPIAVFRQPVNSPARPNSRTKDASCPPC